MAALQSRCSELTAQLERAQADHSEATGHVETHLGRIAELEATVTAVTALNTESAKELAALRSAAEEAAEAAAKAASVAESTQASLRDTIAERDAALTEAKEAQARVQAELEEFQKLGKYVHGGGAVLLCQLSSTPLSLRSPAPALQGARSGE